MIKSKSINLALIGLLALSTSPIYADGISSDVNQSVNPKSNSLDTQTDSSTTSDSSTTLETSESTLDPTNQPQSSKSNTDDLTPSNDSSQSTNTTTEQPTNKLAEVQDSSVATVHNDSEFWAAVNTSTISTINLANDIVAVPVTTALIGRNLTINGNGHNLSYNTTSYGGTFLQTSANGITINIQNLSMGSIAYPANTYYGIVRVESTNVTLNISNLNYLATYGSQPFYANGTAGSVLNFSGVNTFKLGNGSANYGGEFVERFQTVNFKSGSSTTVDQNSGDATAVFWGNTGTNINVESNANLSIKSNKTYLLYNNPTLNIKDNATVTYESYKGMSYTNATLSSGTSIINASSNSKLNLISNDYAINLSGTSINAYNVKSIYAVNNKNIAATSGSMPINRTDSGTYPYTLQTLSTSNVQTTGKDNILANTSMTLNSSTGINGKSWLYTTTPSIDSAKFESQVGSKLSNLNGTIVGSPDTIRNIKVSSEKLYTGNDITTVAAQNQIETSTVAAQTISGNDTSILGSNIKGGQLQYIYYNIQDATAYPGFVLKSKWAEAQNVQTIYQEITIPDKALTFDQPIPGLFTYASNYNVYNSGNVPIKLGVTSVTNQNTNVELVKTGAIFNSDKQEVSLKLNGSSTTTNISWDFKDPGTSTLQVDPYFSTNNIVKFGIDGNYSGPMIGQLPVSYNINFNISQVN